MFNNENNIINDNNHNSTTPHFLSQLKDIIHTSNENPKGEDKIKNKDISENKDNYSKQKEENPNNNIKIDESNNIEEIAFDKNENEYNFKNIKNEEINQNNCDNNNSIKINALIPIEKEKDKEINIYEDLRKDEKRENCFIDNNKDNNNNKNENIIVDKIDNKENIIENKNDDIPDIPDKKINIEKDENKNNKIIEKQNNKENNKDELNRKESKENKKTCKPKEEKHKPSPSCLNNCFKWELKAEIKGKRTFPKNFKSKYIFSGSNVFFKKLDFSILIFYIIH